MLQQMSFSVVLVVLVVVVVVVVALPLVLTCPAHKSLSPQSCLGECLEDPHLLKEGQVS